MTVNVILKEYLHQLKKAEQQKPIQLRRIVPRVVEFAEAAGVSKTGFIKFMNNSNHSISRDMMSSTIMLLRSRGFSVEIQDLIVYMPPEDGGQIP